MVHKGYKFLLRLQNNYPILLFNWIFLMYQNLFKKRKIMRECIKCNGNHTNVRK
jgi:hypothetical protein